MLLTIMVILPMPDAYLAEWHLRLLEESLVELPNASSIFGGGAPQNLFGQTLTSTDVTVGRFGRAQQGTGGLCSSQAQQNAGGSLFNLSIQKQQITNGGNVFTQSTRSQQMQTPPNFGMYQSNKQEAQSVFVQQNVFSQQTPGCIFGQVAQTTSSANLICLVIFPGIW
ncbi:uncharacterized protein LOC118755448 isoform X1 [Rhagoletis pomonella]|uniref:uncharacterized protein LOC118755405 isoform X1 n=2 Tax=Rhagoletis pomonella TaxID=28610 RepID=UPI00177DE58F|nr:uncharacterized protein LOC118755405 isoform X1 [Rhagoletis pomonella]XP_036346173.1 uncharacterized protein LOC118755448 isoform X1 [Rhagoletis pomonella]